MSERLSNKNLQQLLEQDEFEETLEEYFNQQEEIFLDILPRWY